MEKLNETRHARFKRLAEARTEKVLNTIDLIGNLSNKSFYDYSKDEIDLIFKTLEESLKENKQKFTKSKGGKRRFTL